MLPYNYEAPKEDLQFFLKYGDIIDFTKTKPKLAIDILYYNNEFKPRYLMWKIQDIFRIIANEIDEELESVVYLIELCDLMVKYYKYSNYNVMELVYSCVKRDKYVDTIRKIYSDVRFGKLYHFDPHEMLYIYIRLNQWNLVLSHLEKNSMRGGMVSFIKKSGLSHLLDKCAEEIYNIMGLKTPVELLDVYNRPPDGKGWLKRVKELELEQKKFDSYCLS